MVCLQMNADHIYLHIYVYIYIYFMKFLKLQSIQYERDYTCSQSLMSTKKQKGPSICKHLYFQMLNIYM